jgi:hypothetical protein
MVLTVSFVLSPVTGLFATVVSGISPTNLTPASGRQDHTTSPSASSIVRQRAAASTASRLTSVTIAKRPSVWDGMIRSIAVSTKRESEKFCGRGLDTPIAGQPVGQITHDYESKLLAQQVRPSMN